MFFVCSLRKNTFESLNLESLTASIFCLKRNHQNLSTEEYTDNLCSYLCSARSSKTITMDDLNNVMHSIAEKELLNISMDEN